MFDARVRSVMKQAVVTSSSCSVDEAAKLMRRKKVGALVVVRNRTLVGILSERDVVFRVVAAGMDARSVAVGDVMTRSPVTITPSERFGYALHVMHEHGFRHLPVVEGDSVVGIVSARSAADPELEDFAAEANRREHLRRGGFDPAGGLQGAVH